LKAGFRPFLEESAANIDPLLSLRRSHGEDVTEWQDKIEEFRSETLNDAQTIVDDPDEFSHFQEHLRSRLYMTNMALEHNLHKLLKIHRNKMEWLKRPSDSMQSSLPKNSIYESEFSCARPTEVVATENTGAITFDCKPPSPKSVMSIVSRDDAILFSKPAADIVRAIELDGETEEAKDSHETLPGQP
jgi:hypothetical protein